MLSIEKNVQNANKPPYLYPSQRFRGRRFGGIQCFCVSNNAEKSEYTWGQKKGLQESQKDVQPYGKCHEFSRWTRPKAFKCLHNEFRRVSVLASYGNFTRKLPQKNSLIFHFKYCHIPGGWESRVYTGANFGKYSFAQGSDSISETSSMEYSKEAQACTSGQILRGSA